MKFKTCTARELGDYLHTDLEGDGRAVISGVASPERARTEDLIYVDSQRHLERTVASAAQCVLAGADLPLPQKTVLRVADSKFAFAKAAAWLIVAERIAGGTHPTAIVAPTARLGQNVSVGPYVVIEDGAEIGEGSEIGAYCFLGRGARVGESCRLHARVTLYAGVVLGSRVAVHSGAVIGGDGFGYVFGEGRYWKFPQIGTVEVGDDVEIGCNTTIDRGALDATRIAAGVKIDNLVQIAHNVRIGEHAVIAAQTGVSGSSTVGKGAVIGGQVGIADHCTIQEGATCGAQAGIPSGKTIRAGQTVWGTPARPLDKFKEQYAWFARLPELAERVKELERKS